MARFPKSEPEIMALAERLYRGRLDHIATAILSACLPAPSEVRQAGGHAQAGATLVDQPKGKELEYRIIAINKSGEGSPSNTVMVVL